MEQIDKNEPTNDHPQLKADIERMLKKSTKWNRIIGYATVLMVLIGTTSLLMTQEKLIEKNDLVSKENASLKSQNQNLIAMQSIMRENLQAVNKKPLTSIPDEGNLNATNSKPTNKHIPINPPNEVAMTALDTGFNIKLDATSLYSSEQIKLFNDYLKTIAYTNKNLRDSISFLKIRFDRYFQNKRFPSAVNTMTLSSK